MVKIVGHRGASGYATENTLRSFQYAIDIGCDRTELDVRLSKDDAIIVIHDDEVSRVTDGKGIVKDLTLGELKELNCPDNQKLLTLQIELKAEGTPQLVNRLLLKNDIGNEVVITSFDLNLLRETKKLNTALKVGLLFGEYSDELWEFVAEIPLDIIGPKYNIATAELINRAHLLSKIVYAYHVNKKDVGEKLIALCVDEIGSDFPKLFINL
jgi:glycerophosphoryl diester phosphodiesterase